MVEVSCFQRVFKEGGFFRWFKEGGFQMVEELYGFQMVARKMFLFDWKFPKEKLLKKSFKW